MNDLKKYMPIASWLPKYNRQMLTGDLSAGLTVGVMLIPQGMAYSMLAGLPPIYGLYASTVPLLLYAMFGTSRQLAVGPVAMVALLIASGVGQLAPTGSPEFISLAIVLSLMVGVIQLALGVFRLGFLVNFLSHPVISGFTSAAALIIGLNQLKHLLGLDISRSNHIHAILISAVSQITQVHVATLLLGVGGIATILLVKRYSKAIPGPLVAVVAGILAVYTLGLNSQGVQIVGAVPDGFPMPAWPAFTMANLSALMPTALTIGLVGFMESIAVAKAIQARHKNYQVSANQELIGLGLANIGGALFRAFPTTGGFSRTAVNDQAGAKSGMASIFSAVLIILTLLFLTPLFYFLPKAILASVIMVAVFGLIDFKEAIHLWQTDRKDFAMLLVTFLATLWFGIEQGIALGVVLSLALVLYRSSYPHMAVLGQIPNTNIYRNLKRFPEAIVRPDVAILRFDAQLFFANLTHFKDEADQLVASKPDLKLFIVSAEAINALDSSAVHMLKDFVANLQGAGVQLAFSAVKGPVRDILHKNGIVDLIGAHNFFVTTAHAVEAYDNQQSQPISAQATATGANNRVALQTNAN